MVVLDASVVLKWLLLDPAREPDTAKASDVIEAVARGRLEILQPVHWLAEVAAVAARLSPKTAVSDVDMLTAFEFPTTNDPSVMRRAAHLSVATRHHLFDTLYHAVALEHEGAVLLTADDRYYAKTLHFGQIVALRDWVPVS